MIKICSDTIDAASGEFGEALENGRLTAVVEYHDSRGYLEYVAQQVADQDHLDASKRQCRLAIDAQERVDAIEHVGAHHRNLIDKNVLNVTPFVFN